MKQRQFVQISLLIITATVSISQALADSAPPDYVEQCTLAKQQLPGKSCVSCSATHLNPNACQNQYASQQGYTKICKSLGPSSWTEVWCKDGAVAPSGGGPNSGVGGAAEINPDVPAEVGCNCRMSGRGGESTSGAALGAMALAWLGLRRRRRWA